MTYSKPVMDLHFSINSFVHTLICTAPLLSPVEGEAVSSQAFSCIVCGPTILQLENHTDDTATRLNCSKVMPQTPLVNTR